MQPQTTYLTEATIQSDGRIIVVKTMSPYGAGELRRIERPKLGESLDDAYSRIVSEYTNSHGE